MWFERCTLEITQETSNNRNGGGVHLSTLPITSRQNYANGKGFIAVTCSKTNNDNSSTHPLEERNGVRTHRFSATAKRDRTEAYLIFPELETAPLPSQEWFSKVATSRKLNERRRGDTAHGEIIRGWRQRTLHLCRGRLSKLAQLVSFTSVAKI